MSETPSQEKTDAAARQPRTHVIVVAAGSGSRFGTHMPKQFCTLGDRPVLMHTVVALARSLPGASISIVLSKDWIEPWQKMCEQHGLVSPTLVCGGASRWESVKNAVEALDADDADVVLVHDGVRPMVRKPMVARIMKAMLTADAAIPAIPVTDSLRETAADGHGSRALDRNHLVAVQTPQAFRAGKLRQAYRLPFTPAFTDDASVYEAAGYGDPVLVEGDPLNLKITHPRDIDIMALYMGR